MGGGDCSCLRCCGGREPSGSANPLRALTGLLSQGPQGRAEWMGCKSLRSFAGSCLQPSPSPGLCPLGGLAKAKAALLWWWLFSRSVVSASLPPHGLQQARLPCPSPNSQSLFKLMSIESVMPISSSILYSSCLQSFPASGSFPINWLLASGSQSIGSFSFSISPSNEY